MTEDSKPETKFGLADCLQELRSDLIATMKDGGDKDLKLVVEDISLDLQIVASDSAKAGGGVKWWVLNAEAGAEISQSMTQKLNLKLKVVDKDGKPVLMSGRTT